MAKKNKQPKATESSAPAQEEKAKEEGLSSGGKAMALFLLTVALSIGAYIGWRYRTHPNHLWAQRMRAERNTRLVAHLNRCFTSLDGAAVRVHLPAVRSGTLPPGLRRCRGGPLTEGGMGAADMLGAIHNVPLSAESARSREVDALRHLRASIERTNQTLARLPEDNSIPVDVRETLATQLDEVATNLDTEHRNFEDMLRTAEDGVSL